jgi:hypothetical protein
MARNLAKIVMFRECASAHVLIGRDSDSRKTVILTVPHNGKSTRVVIRGARHILSSAIDDGWIRMRSHGVLQLQRRTYAGPKC